MVSTMIDGIDRVRWWFWSANLGGGTSCGSGVFWSVGVESMLRFGQSEFGVLVLEVETSRFEKSWLRVEEPPKTWSFRWRGSRV